MCTHWQSTKLLGASNLSCCDLGAQYLTRNTEEFGTLFDELSNQGILAPLNHARITGARPDQNSKRHYVATSGMSSMVAYLGASAKIYTSRTLTNLIATPERQWLASSAIFPRAAVIQDANDDNSKFDAVILAVTASQLLSFEFLRSLCESNGCGGLLERLRAVTYSCRFAVACYYPPAGWEALAGVEWIAKYNPPPSPIRYISIESRKMAGDDFSTSDAIGPAILIHSSVPFAVQLVDQYKSSQRGDLGEAVTGNDPSHDRLLAMAESMLLAELNSMFPALGTPLNVHTKLWHESQVSVPLTAAAAAERVGDGDLVLPPLVLAGDLFSESNFEGCLRSASAAAHLVADALRKYENA